MQYHLSSPDSSISRKLNLLKNAIEGDLVVRPKNVSKFVFLCGANKPDGGISERRRALLSFAQKHLPHTQFFLAEKIFPLLQKEGHKENILDIEHDISKFSDQILIVLESFSAFAELGAFSHKELREKIIVINDVKFKDADSFINLGPIKAIEEKNGSESIIYYDMNEDGTIKLDSIGSTFRHLYKLLKLPLTQKPIPLKSDEINPAKSFNKDSLRFVHDLIYITGPINRREIIELLKFIFNKKYDFKKVTEHIAMLSAFDAISTLEGNIYKSSLKSLYLDYKFDINYVTSTFRNYYMKYMPERIYGT
jgi:hypothetical protein